MMHHDKSYIIMKNNSKSQQRNDSNLTLRGGRALLRGRRWLQLRGLVPEVVDVGAWGTRISGGSFTPKKGHGPNRNRWFT